MTDDVTLVSARSGSEFLRVTLRDKPREQAPSDLAQINESRRCTPPSRAATTADAEIGAAIGRRCGGTDRFGGRVASWLAICEPNHYRRFRNDDDGSIPPPHR